MAVTPQDLINTLPDWYLKSKRNALQWLVGATQDDLSSRRALIKSRRESRTAAFMDFLQGALGLPMLIACFAFCVQLFGQLGTMQHLPWFPSLFVTAGVFAVIVGAFWGATTRLHALRPPEGDVGLLAPVSAEAGEELFRLAGKHEKIRVWYEHVTLTLKRPFCQVEHDWLEYLARRDYWDAEPARRDALLAYEAPLDVQSRTAADLIAALNNAGACEGLTAAERQELLLDSDDRLTQKREESQKIYDRHFRVGEGFVKLGNFHNLALKASWLAAVAAVCLGTGLFWAAATVAEPPYIVVQLAKVGGGYLAFMAVCLMVFGCFVIRTWPEAVVRADNRQRNLMVLNSQYDEIAGYLMKYESVRVWHNHIVHTQKRQYRSADLYLVRALVERDGGVLDLRVTGAVQELCASAGQGHTASEGVEQ